MDSSTSTTVRITRDADNIATGWIDLPGKSVNTGTPARQAGPRAALPDLAANGTDRVLLAAAHQDGNEDRHDGRGASARGPVRGVKGVGAWTLAPGGSRPGRILWARHPVPANAFLPPPRVVDPPEDLRPLHRPAQGDRGRAH